MTISVPRTREESDVDIRISAASGQVLVAFVCYLIGVAALGIFSHRYLSRGSFIKEYFLGNRGLGPWVLALTVAATAISGGTFMGFPSLIYSNGWIMALWIAGYTVVPIMVMALLGKRINQVARQSGAVTVPDVFRDRFASPALGVTCSLLILFFLLFNLVAQFKAGGLVMKEAIRLPSAQATLLPERTRIDAQHNLALTFQEPDGTLDRQRTPLPSESAAYLSARTQVDQERQQVRVYFQAGPNTIEKQVKFPPQKLHVPGTGLRVELGYLLGLFIFALTVVAYTTYGGFWAVTWTDVLEGLVMLIGVITMTVLALKAVPPIDGHTGLAAATEHLRRLKPPEGKAGDLVYGPGPKGFLPLGLAFSYFLVWTVAGAGLPGGMVRLMSFKDTSSLRRALMLVALYFLVTYVCMLVIFICARAIFPTQYLREIGSEGEPDSIMPAMTRHLAHPLVAGLLLAAPYAAIMSTVAAFLLLISSSLVRDLYQRTINPHVSDRTVKRASYAVTALAGIGVAAAAINPPGFLQYIIVFTGSGQGCSFLFPMALGLYWRRSTRQGVLAGMIGGFLVLLSLYALGWLDNVSQASEGSRWIQEHLRWLPGWGQKRPDKFAPLYAGGVDPVVWGLLASLLLTVGVSLVTRPDPELVKTYFP
jgi:Na+/proline symporter